MKTLSQIRAQLASCFEQHGPAEQELGAFMCAYGAACFRAQTLEMELRLLLLANELQPARPITEEAAQRIDRPLARETLGGLVRRVRDRSLVLPALLNQLEAVCARRNQLVHHLLERMLGAVVVRGGWLQLVAECHATASDLDAAGKAIAPLAEVAADQLCIHKMQAESILQELFPAEA
jgi:hypothetical protein